MLNCLDYFKRLGQQYAAKEEFKKFANSVQEYSYFTLVQLKNK